MAIDRFVNSPLYPSRHVAERGFWSQLSLRNSALRWRGDFPICNELTSVAKPCSYSPTNGYFYGLIVIYNII